MILMYFTERPYREVPEEEVIKNRAFFVMRARIAASTFITAPMQKGVP